MQVVILAGGLGTRLQGAIPAGLPKPMAPVGGRPFLDHVLDRALAEGADEFLLLTGYSSEAISAHLGSEYRGTPVRYSVEPEPLGTGGALRHASGMLADHFILLNGDTYTEVAFGALIAQLSFGPLAMALTRMDDTSRFGRVDVQEGVVVGFREKGTIGPGVINAGVYACRRELVDLLPAGRKLSFENDLMTARLADLRPRFVVTTPVFFDIGVPADYAAADEYFTAAGRGTRGTPQP